MRTTAIILAAALAIAAPTLALGQNDPLRLFAEAVSMVTSDGVQVVENEHGVESSRFINVGDEYRDGWVLQAAAPTNAILKKGSETRSVNYGARMRGLLAPAAPTVVVAAAPSGGLSNAGAPRPSGGRAEIDAAVQARDVGKVYSLGGSANDVANSIAAFWPNVSAMLAEGGQASYVNVGGQVGIRVRAGGREQVIVPPRLAGQAPPANAETVATPSGFGTGGAFLQAR